MKPRMSRALTLMGLGTFLLASTLAVAGNESGHGGGAFICPNPNDSELLDLFEARVPGAVTPEGLRPEKSKKLAKPGALKDVIDDALSRFVPGSPIYLELQATYARIRQAKAYPVPAFQIAWPRDANNGLVKPGCKPVGLILFKDDENSMFRDDKSLASLPLRQLAALWVHETIYKYLREKFKDEDSVRARKIVAHVFSDESQAVFDREVYRLCPEMIAVQNSAIQDTGTAEDLYLDDLDAACSRDTFRDNLGAFVRGQPLSDPCSKGFGLNRSLLRVGFDRDSEVAPDPHYDDQDYFHDLPDAIAQMRRYLQTRSNADVRSIDLDQILGSIEPGSDSRCSNFRMKTSPNPRECHVMMGVLEKLARRFEKICVRRIAGEHRGFRSWTLVSQAELVQECFGTLMRRQY